MTTIIFSVQTEKKDGSYKFASYDFSTLEDARKHAAEKSDHSRLSEEDKKYWIQYHQVIYRRTIESELLETIE